MLKVVKFGGSSVSGAEQFKKVKNIIESDSSRRLVVVSAAGKRFEDDHKMTDLLYLCHAHLKYGVSCDDIMDSIEQRFVEIKNDLGLQYDVKADFDALRARLNKNMSVDELVSRGEYFTARLMAEYLGFSFVDAKDCFFFGLDGQIDREKTDEAVKEALNKYGKIVIPGFYGSIVGGKIRIMSRGGSDISGAIASAAVDADVYENWTDVSGILMADPRIVDNPKSISRLTYAELRELAFMGASVLHEESIMPVKERGIALNIRNTNEPEHPGTMIVESIDEKNGAERPITGIAGRKNFSVITVNKRNINISVTLRQVLDIFDKYKVPVEHIDLGLDSFAIVASTTAMGDAVYDIASDIKKTCRPDRVYMQEGIALVAAVGRKMTFRPGTSGRLFKALGDNGVNIRIIAQGADELSIMVGVENTQFETAIKVLYEGFAG